MKNVYQTPSSYTELEDTNDYNDLSQLTDSKINFLDICSIVILFISAGFLFESIIF
ncbi:hypothetical protein SAMN05216503_1888 [Polaribacter sp. KT25b]|uniref:hypothetical protein n=1 Tax=Polaribacter sp. KT25b TaxID=1855336 RepID=UPI00087A0AEB|nr:hypothetical protein [Polaribacter sp. KT25b]SDS07192.1 hypothetical protein SAMN05216503_1888 [Polaribacter sp. KT25b]